MDKNNDFPGGVRCGKTIPNMEWFIDSMKKLNPGETFELVDTDNGNRKLTFECIKIETDNDCRPCYEEKIKNQSPYISCDAYSSDNPRCDKCKKPYGNCSCD